MKYSTVYQLYYYQSTNTCGVEDLLNEGWLDTASIIRNTTCVMVTTRCFDVNYKDYDFLISSPHPPPVPSSPCPFPSNRARMVRSRRNNIIFSWRMVVMKSETAWKPENCCFHPATVQYHSFSCSRPRLLLVVGGKTRFFYLILVSRQTRQRQTKTSKYQ